METVVQISGLIKGSLCYFKYESCVRYKIDLSCPMHMWLFIFKTIKIQFRVTVTTFQVITTCDY